MTRHCTPAFLALLALLSQGCGEAGNPVSPAIPDVEGFPPIPIPESNPATRAGIALGRHLFYDTILSGDGTQSCASCHSQSAAFAVDERVHVGSDGVSGTRNAPALVNVAWSPTLFWDGRVVGLEEQARLPVPTEMHLPWDGAVARLNAHPEYPARFEWAFGSPVASEDRVVKALAQFERTLISNDSHYDRFLRGESTLSEAEHRGMELFFSEKALCFHCHGSILMTDFAFHDIGLDEDPADPGLALVTGDPEDSGRFRTPTLRNVEYSAPYMHDGRFATLEDVVEHYATGIQASPNLDFRIADQQSLGFHLTNQDKEDLVAFLRTLSDPGFVTNPELGRPGGGR